MRKNPAVWISLIAAALTLAIGFGLKLSDAQASNIIKFAEILIPVIITSGAGFAIRSQVYSPDSAQTLLDMPQGTKMALANRALAAEVPVLPSDTHADVVKKVEVAEKAANV